MTTTTIILEIGQRVIYRHAPGSSPATGTILAIEPIANAPYFVEFEMPYIHDRGKAHDVERWDWAWARDDQLEST